MIFCEFIFHFRLQKGGIYHTHIFILLLIARLKPSRHVQMVYFVWGCKMSRNCVRFEKLSIFEIHDYFLDCISDEFLHIWTSEQKVEVLTENARYIFCRSSKYLSCGGITLGNSVLVFSRNSISKLVGSEPVLNRFCSGNFQN